MLLTSNKHHYKQCSKFHIYLKAVTAVVPISSLFLGQFKFYSVLEVSPPCSQESEFYNNPCRKMTILWALKNFHS